MNVKLIVPYGTKEAYSNSAPWKNFWNIEEMPGVNTEKVEVSTVNAEMHIGDTIRLTGTKYPENSMDTIQWKSSDVKIATVSDDGIVTAIGTGTATITATSGDVSATCEVTVHEPNIEIEFASNTLTVAVEGSDSSIEVSVFTALGQRVYKQSLEASSVVKKEIDLSNLTPGTYIVQIVSGEMNASKIIVKQ